VNLLQVLNSLSPLGVISLLAYIIYLQVKQQKSSSSQLANIADNHLHELPTILETLQRIEINQAAAFSTIIAKLNGGSK
jgi:hypothetical protein